MRAGRVENVGVKRALQIFEHPGVLPGALLGVVLALGAGCRGGAADGPPCGAAGAKFMALAKDDLEHTTVDAEMRRAVADQLPAMRDSLVHVCTDSKWSGAVRTCLVDAKDRVAFEACEQQLTDAQRQALDRSAQGKAPDDPQPSPPNNPPGTSK